MAGKIAIYTTQKALSDIIMWVGDSLTPETISHIEDVLEKLNSSSWGVGYKDAQEDCECE